MNSIRELRKFGFTLSAAICLIAAIFSFRHRNFYALPFALAALSFITAVAFPLCLKPLHRIMTRVSLAIGWVNTKVLLFLIFYLIITPLGLIIRIFGRDLLNRKIERGKASYWIKREAAPFNRSRYEQLF